MLQVTLTEQMVNAIGAGLELRTQTLAASLTRLNRQPQTAGRDEAICFITDAIRDTIVTQLALGAAAEEPEYPDNMTFADLAADPSSAWHYELDR